MPRVAAVLVLTETDRDVTAHGAVFGLVAGIDRDVAAGAKVAVVGRPGVEFAFAQPQAKLPFWPQPYSARTQPPILMHISVPGM